MEYKITNSETGESIDVDPSEFYDCIDEEDVALDMADMFEDPIDDPSNALVIPAEFWKEWAAIGHKDDHDFDINVQTVVSTAVSLSPIDFLSCDTEEEVKDSICSLANDMLEDSDIVTQTPNIPKQFWAEWRNLKKQNDN